MLNLPAIELFSDIYYTRDYSDLYDIDADYFEYTYEYENKIITFTSLKKRIKTIAGFECNEELYDLETPYGYGGPVSNTNDRDFLEKAFASYKEYCRSKKIVCEFIRFHPFNTLVGSGFLFDMHIKERNVVIVNLECSAEKRRSLYSKTTRNILKKNTDNFCVSSSLSDIDKFIEMYYQTMNKNNASDFYYFDKNYFEKLSKINGVNLISLKSRNDYASMAYFLFGKDIAHYHLSANNTQLNNLNGNYHILDNAFDLAKDKGCKYMMLGGGRTPSLSDSLYVFKKKFSPFELPFYIAGLDFIPGKREELNGIWRKIKNINTDTNLFQQYRV